MRILERREIELNQITTFDPRVAGFIAELSDRDFVAVSSGFTEEAAFDLALLHPIFLSQRNNKIFVVAGAKTFQVVKSVLRPESKVGCFIVQGTSDEILRLAKTDLVGSPCLFSLSTKVAQQTKKLVDVLGGESASRIHSDLRSIRGMTRIHERRK
ncbi:hypothetical protein FM042_07950 [Aliidiomarina halalkaliphila]|uniref:Uncharacterized protein n=1 Tax=Aliidiomarina halalkaliphila TaxID=2593535 RepID=A0A552X1S9_9GAMM|nr:hypothetical protein [Aliidiomarina halalkaliphila]TRW48906.1 hypothetical protein FM042_07950 [Aliidiomarina halalkaliphila]